MSGFGVQTISCSVDVNYYRARYMQEMHFRNGAILSNVGYLWSSSVGPMVFEVNEI